MGSKKRKILIVEDNIDLQSILSISFESEGFEVTQSFDGLRGLIEVVNENPDVILLDIMMPEMDGFEVLNTIANNSSYLNPIIICSNMSHEQFKEKRASMYASMFIPKSQYDGSEIVEKVIKFLDEHKEKRIKQKTKVA